MKPKTKRDIENEFQSKITARQYYLQVKYRARKEKGYVKIDDVEEDKKNKELQRYIKECEVKRDQQLKNFERGETGKKIIVYKKKKKPKKITKTAILTLLQKYARLRDSDNEGYGKCISCGIRLHYKEGHGCHYISRQWNATAYDLDNIHLGCKTCNYLTMTGGKQGDIIKESFRAALVHKLGGERVKELEINKSASVDTRQYLTHDNYEYWLSKVNELESTKVLSH